MALCKEKWLEKWLLPRVVTRKARKVQICLVRFASTLPEGSRGFRLEMYCTARQYIELFVVVIVRSRGFLFLLLSLEVISRNPSPPSRRSPQKKKKKAGDSIKCVAFFEGGAAV